MDLLHASIMNKGMCLEGNQFFIGYTRDIKPKLSTDFLRLSGEAVVIRLQMD
jgi:hypothetical protein